MAFPLLMLAMSIEVVGSMSLRASDGLRKKIWLIPVLISYALSFLLLVKVLSMGLAIGAVYGIWAAGGVALTALTAHLLFKEPLGSRRIVGLAFIAVGVLTIELSR